MKPFDAFLADIEAVPELERVAAINEARRALHALSPHRGEPVDLVLWVESSLVVANDYNPNSVAPPEMRLLRTSIESDGYTQPIVTWRREDGIYEVVDGFHRTRVGKEDLEVRKRLMSFLPVVVVNEGRQDVGDRMAATIRHNRARGRHLVDGMSEIVVALRRRKWSDEKIGKELGMEPDEVLRLTQIGGLASMFADKEFSKAWEQDPS